MKIESSEANCVIFEDYLSPSQQKNLINRLNIKVLDRTNLILDIFARRARSKEGKIQVELAQLNYLLPRLTGQGINLSRLGGGVGTRGPGETKLETDRRHIRRRIKSLKTQLQEIKKHRATQYSQRTKNSIPQVTLVGYTNTGKSSLLNVLANENILAEDKLFATLDPTTRAIDLGEKHEVLMTDTVGFIRNLPHQLVSAFKATLDEVKLANLLIHVIDINDENLENHLKTVQEVLGELDCLDKPVIYVFNKLDLIIEQPVLPLMNDKYCLVSTKTLAGIDNLKEMIKKHFFANENKFELLIPFEQGHLLDSLYRRGKVEVIKHSTQGTKILFASQENLSPELQKYLITE